MRRRRLMQIGGATVAATAVVGGIVAYERTRPPVFRHGVASADPTSRSVLLWTRVTVEEPEPVEVEWLVAKDADLDDVVAEGVVSATPARDFTVQVDVAGLAPATTYYYRFRARRQRSKVGRTRTLPEGPHETLKIAFVCCSSLAHGGFYALAKLASLDDLDLVVHLGDYIYEFASGTYGQARKYDPEHTCVTLDDYRRRHRQYKTDRWLAECHRRVPWVTLWDDHDFANNALPEGADGHKKADHGEWAPRLEAARQAFLEYVPARAESSGPLSRSFSLGELGDLVIADARMGEKTPPAKKRSRETMLGQPQEEWLTSALEASRGRWCILAQQLIFAPFKVTPPYDQAWQAYPRSRARLINRVVSHARGRTLFISGDIHAAAASVIHASPTEPSEAPPVMVELVAPSISSPFPFDPATFESNAHFVYSNVTERGYLLLELGRDRATATFHHVTPPKSRQEPAVWTVGKRFEIDHGVVALRDVPV